MLLQRTFTHLALLAVAACVLTACESAGRHSSPNYHINSMERKDTNAHYPMDERTKRMEKAMMKDK